MGNKEMVRLLLILENSIQTSSTEFTKFLDEPTQRAALQGVFWHCTPNKLHVLETNYKDVKFSLQVLAGELALHANMLGIKMADVVDAYTGSMYSASKAYAEDINLNDCPQHEMLTNNPWLAVLCLTSFVNNNLGMSSTYGLVPAR